ncbi:MAG TPA: polymer-forming cytoskeletal protein [Candidatus Saccharimonadales bacterium]
MKRRLFGLAVAVALIMAGVFWGTASAQSFRSGSTATVRPDEVIDSSLWISGRTVDIAGQVNGDVFCAGQNVTVSGTVSGDLLCAAQTIVISGSVAGDVRSVGQTVTMSGSVEQNLSIAAQSFTQDAKSSVGGDASLAAGDASLSGSVGRDAAMTAQSIVLSGQIGRDVTATVENLQLNQGATINGNLAYTSKNDAKIASGVVVNGETTKSQPKERRDGAAPTGGGFSFGFALYLLVAGLLTALVLVLLFPQAIRAVTDQAVRSPWKTLLVGFIAALAVPALILLLMITVIGIPLALLIIVAWILIQAFAGVAAAYYLGRLILRKRRNPILTMLLGATLLIILYFIPILGIIVWLAAMFWGTGMILLELNRRRPAPKYDTGA